MFKRLLGKKKFYWDDVYSKRGSKQCCKVKYLTPMYLLRTPHGNKYTGDHSQWPIVQRTPQVTSGLDLNFLLIRRLNPKSPFFLTFPFAQHLIEHYRLTKNSASCVFWQVFSLYIYIYEISVALKCTCFCCCFVFFPLNEQQHHERWLGRLEFRFHLLLLLPPANTWTATEMEDITRGWPATNRQLRHTADCTRTPWILCWS